MDFKLEPFRLGIGVGTDDQSRIFGIFRKGVFEFQEPVADAESCGLNALRKGLAVCLNEGMKGSGFRHGCGISYDKARRATVVMLWRNLPDDIFDALAAACAKFIGGNMAVCVRVDNAIEDLDMDFGAVRVAIDSEFWLEAASLPFFNIDEQAIAEPVGVSFPGGFPVLHDALIRSQSMAECIQGIGMQIAEVEEIAPYSQSGN